MALKILISPKQGMCFGVKRALELAEKTAEEKEGKRIFTYGPLVHNKNVVNELEKKGIIVANSIDKLEKGDTAIIRAHGISDKELRDLKEKGIEIIDATCPYVSKLKQTAKDMEEHGFKVVILGQKDHPEVKGIAESLNNPIMISSPQEAKAITEKKIGFVSQTTQSENIFKQVADELRKPNVEVDVVDTICNATSERQESAGKTASESDIMLVIGDKCSANTNKLAEICSDITETKHIEGASELKPEWFLGRKSAGITAGASTPDWIVEEVVERLKQL